MRQTPKDIDVMVIGSTERSGQRIIEIDTVPFPLDVQFLSQAEYQTKRDNLDMAFLSCWFCTPGGRVDITDSDAAVLFTQDPYKTRDAISRNSSAAWAKGHKKLTVLQDYDQNLGIKNIMHSVYFPQRAVELMHMQMLLNSLKTGSTLQSTEGLVQIMKEQQEVNKYLQQESERIYSTDNSCSTEEKWGEFKLIVKPELNKAMSKFRTYFPKETE